MYVVSQSYSRITSLINNNSATYTSLINNNSSATYMSLINNNNTSATYTSLINNKNTSATYGYMLLTNKTTINDIFVSITYESLMLLQLLTKLPLLFLVLLFFMNNPIEATSFQSNSLTNLNSIMDNQNSPIRNLNNMNPPYRTPGQAPPPPMGFAPGTVFTNQRCRSVPFLPGGCTVPAQGTPTATMPFCGRTTQQTPTITIRPPATLQTPNDFPTSYYS